jgi:uncharacterized protein
MIRNNRIATLALCRNNEPYVVTLTYGYDNDLRTLYFHCGKEGLKLEFINANPNVCLTIIENNGIGTQTCDHPYASIIIRGKIEIVNTTEEMDKAIRKMIEQLEKKNTDKEYSKLNTNNKFYNDLIVLKVRIEEITGKQKFKKG